jgi:hypothetical protein
LVSRFNLSQSFNYTPYLFYKNLSNPRSITVFLYMDPERIDLWFEVFFVKEIRRVIKWLRENKTLTNNKEQHTLFQISSDTAKYIFRLNVN